MSRSKNGEAQTPSYLLVFDVSDDAQKRAWSVMQKLAAQRRSKRTLLGFLLALDEIQKRTGSEHSVDDMMARFIASMVASEGTLRGYAQFPSGDLFEDTPSIIVGTADHADPDEIRDELALSMGDLFGDDD